MNLLTFTDDMQSAGGWVHQGFKSYASLPNVDDILKFGSQEWRVAFVIAPPAYPGNENPDPWVFLVKA